MINRREALFVIGSLGCCAIAAEIPPPRESYDVRGYPLPEDNAICANCYWWDELRADYADRIGLTENYRQGWCRVNPPTANGFGRSVHIDRCGKFQAREA